MVSVIVPNYNHAAYLKQRLESILSQTYRDIEVIILDDCSTDNSREIIEQYRAHPRVSAVVFNEKNSGSTFRQWQKGISLAKGEWIWIAESDDSCDPDFLSVLLDDGVGNEAGVRFCRSREIDSAGNVLMSEPYPIETGTTNGLDFLMRYLMEVSRIQNASAVVLRRELVERIITPEIETFKLVGDWLVWCKLCFKTAVFYSVNTTNFHRQHSTNVRSRMAEQGNFFSEFNAFRLLLEEEIKQAPMDASMRKLLLNKNRALQYHETGMRGIELIKNRNFSSGLPLILQASVRPVINLYFVKSFFYWMLKRS